MPQSLSKVILHIIFSTKNREPWLESNVRPRVHAYLATICRDFGAELVRVGGVVDHVHIVTTLPRTVSQAQLVEQIKKTFSKSLPSAPPPLPASGERIEVRGIRKPFSEEALTVRTNRRWIALDCCERRRLSPNVFFGDTYGTEISRATNFAANIRSIVTSWISIVRAQS
jgi:REP element-mobilizing transposase RayT